MSFALIIPALIACIGVGIDFATYTAKSATLQAAADAAALAATKQLSVASSTDLAVKSVATNFLAKQLTGDDAQTTNIVAVDRVNGKVSIQLTEDWVPMFASYIGLPVTPINKSSVAQLQGETRLCVLLLDPSAQKAMWIDNKASINASNCGIYSNSSNSKSIFVTNIATINASVICAVGGVKTGPLTVTSVPPQSGCPVFPDPLASRAAPSPSANCLPNPNATSGSIVLQPGTYCHGITIAGTANVTFASGSAGAAGDFVVSGGSLAIGGNSVVTGKNVDFYLSGSSATINITGGASVDFSGAETGPMAGLLFFADRSTSGLSHQINATNVAALTGTIYLPTGFLQVDPSAVVGQQSAYTAIIANTMELVNGPTLYMNTNYSATNVPVPPGVRAPSSVVLVQ